MRLANLRIGTRLGLCFAIVLLLMTILIVVGQQRLSSIGSLTDTIIEKDWAKARAASTISTTTRANSAVVMELLVNSDPAHAAELKRQLEANKNTISASLDTLDKLIYAPEAKELIKQIRSQRAEYVQSFTQVLSRLDAGEREAASQLAIRDTMPRLAALQASVERMVQIQSELVTHHSSMVMADISMARQLMVGLGIFALLLGAFCAWWVTRSITRPISHALEVAKAVASGDLTTDIRAQHKDEAGQLLHALRDMNHSLSNIVGQVRHGTVAISSASGEIASGNMDLSSRTETQASALEETASSMEELTSTVRQNADNARAANQLAQSASQVAQRGGEVVSQVVATMGSINDSSRRVVDIISVIDGIAFQTNILALNAAVEAARAGEQGRGFAVVASEVRNLAGRSAAAAREIKELISASVEQVEAGSRLVQQAGVTMDEVVASVGRVTSIVGDITLATSEQSEGIEQVNVAITQMDHTTQQNAALVEQAAAAAAAMNEQAGTLEQLVSQFRLSGDSQQRRVAAAVPRPGMPRLGAA